MRRSPPAWSPPMSATTARPASYHVGNLLSIMMLRWFQKTGHRPITLMGGGTTRVGDPSGKDESRKLLTYDEIEANKQSLKATFAKFVDFDERRQRRHHDRQCRMAGAAQLHRFPARCRPLLLGQPHARHGLGQAPARPRARALLPRVQLHGAAGLRLRRAQPALRLHACRSAAPTSGATSSTASTSAGAWASRSSMR